MYDLFTVSSLAVVIASIIAASFFFLQSQKLRKSISAQEVKIRGKEQEMNNRMYELAILKELGDRVGYSLDIHQIIDIITGSLHQFIKYSAVSYMLIEPEKVLFKIHLEESVHRNFVDEVRDRMLKSISALLDKEFKKDQVDEVLSGAVLIEEVQDPVRSFFNIPIVIRDKVVGVLTVAHTESGLYKEDEMTILYKITNQASQAVTRLQEVVALEQSKLNAMVKSMADGVVMTDLDYRILAINPAAKAVIGLPDKKEITIFDFIDNLEGKFDIRGRLEESVKLEKEYISERIVLGERYIQVFVFPVKSPTLIERESILGGVVIFHDVTAEMKVEQLRKDFTSMIVHELRSPLDGIKKISKVLRDKEITPTSKKYSEYLQLIYQNSSGILELVNDILDVAKIEAGKFSIKKRIGNIVDIVNGRVSFYALSAKDAGIKIQASYGDNIPQEIMFDSEGIAHVLNNLISNALKFTKQQGEISVITFIHEEGRDIQEEAMKAGYTSHLPISLKKKSKDPILVVLVFDTGIGISEEGIGHIFRKFTQLDIKNTGDKIQKGTGLGLVIAKGVVDEHGGEINVASELEVGSTFYFTIPLV